MPSLDSRFILFSRHTAFSRISLYFSQYFFNFILCIPEFCPAKFNKKGGPFYLSLKHVDIGIFAFYLTYYLLQLRQSLGVGKLPALGHDSVSPFAHL